jgi:hypothetical protein
MRIQQSIYSYEESHSHAHSSMLVPHADTGAVVSRKLVLKKLLKSSLQAEAFEF